MADKLALLLAVPASISWPLTAGMQAVRSRTGRVKNLLTEDGRHIISPRLVDGGISLTKEGAKLLHAARIAAMPIGFPKSATPFSGPHNYGFVTTFPPSNNLPGGPSSDPSSGLDMSGGVDSTSDLDIGVPWVVIEEGAVPFVGQGRNVIHGFISAADAHLSPGLSCLVVDAAGRLVAEGVSLSTAAEMGRFRKGLAVKVRNGFLKA
jgi:predicted RNA-binding protein (TIGR00451 family)